ncbi:GNAT family N-acetyltransferase [Staphylococcus sp. Mo2-6]|uniref:GNAT family N-acetyltransferase n=1 Tax=Staphylococcus sp. Mo2-6 TaxID=3135641 RepID=UPI003D02C7C2
MENIKVQMVRTQLDDIPQYDVPKGFVIRKFRKGDEKLWAYIETLAGEFTTEDMALERFDKEFGDHVTEMEQRCIFIENEEQEVVGTTTAWYGYLGDDSQMMGRIHWVGIIPAYQGKKLSKPLLSAAMNILALHHNKAYLTSQTISYKAINMYLEFGFKPVQLDDNYHRAWQLLAQKLNENRGGNKQSKFEI